MALYLPNINLLLYAFEDVGLDQYSIVTELDLTVFIFKRSITLLVSSKRIILPFEVR